MPQNGETFSLSFCYTSMAYSYNKQKEDDMSKEIRSVTVNGVATTVKSTRETALDAALRMPHKNFNELGENESYASELVDAATLIEAYLDSRSLPTVY